jgi:hypothetical protein
MESTAKISLEYLKELEEKARWYDDNVDIVDNGKELIQQIRELKLKLSVSGQLLKKEKESHDVWFNRYADASSQEYKLRTLIKNYQEELKLFVPTIFGLYKKQK